MLIPLIHHDFFLNFGMVFENLLKSGFNHARSYSYRKPTNSVEIFFTEQTFSE